MNKLRDGKRTGALVLRRLRKLRAAALGLEVTDDNLNEDPILKAASAIVWPKTMRLLGSSLKVEKGTKQGYLTAILYLAPGDRSVPYGGKDVCPWRSPACSALCLGHTSGQLSMSNAHNAEAWKTLLWVHWRDKFLRLLVSDIRKHAAKAVRKSLLPAVRLNGSSDISWERVAPQLFSAFPAVQFYDYTKSQARALDFATQAFGFPHNYHLTYSRCENDNDSLIGALVQTGVNVAIVFEQAYSNWYNAHNPFGEPYPVLDGDKDDLRFLDPRGMIVALSPKGSKAKQDTSGFVVR